MTSRECLLKMRYDLTALQAHVTELLKFQDELDRVPKPGPAGVCEECFCGNGIHTIECRNAPKGRDSDAGFGRWPVSGALLKEMRERWERPNTNYKATAQQSPPDSAVSESAVGEAKAS